MTVYLRHLNNRDGWKQFWRHMNNYYRQHGASMHQTLSSCIWRDPHRWIRTFEEPNLKSRKSRIKINNMPRSKSNHHQLQLPVNKKQEKTQKKTTKTAATTKSFSDHHITVATTPATRTSNSFSNCEPKWRSDEPPTQQPDKTEHAKNNLNLRRKNKLGGGADSRPILAPPTARIYISKWEI